MRTLTGFFFNSLLFIFFSIMVVNATEEVRKVESLEKIMNDRIDVHHIHLPTNSYIYAHDGQMVSEIYRDEYRIYLPYEQIPDKVVNAFLAIEDQRFFEHKGYDMPAIVRALIANAKSDSIQQGASTITQQVVKNLFLTQEQTYNRKLAELLYAYQLEETYPKEKIFELYFNSIYFHNSIYGFETASQYYFQKPSHKLSLAEVAFLSAIPNNPSYYDPILHSENTHERKKIILEKMLEANFITEKQYNEAIEEEIVLNVRQKIDLYPDYVTYIHHEFRELVAEKEGFKEKLLNVETKEEKEKINEALNDRINELYEQGIHIETYLHRDAQEKAAEAIEKHVPYADIQGAAAIIDHTKDAVIAITGGKNYNKFNFHRGFQAYRQPGSSIKPLLVYGPYFSEYKKPIHTLVNANNFCKNGYCPRNFGGAQYGNVTIEQAFIHSYNTPAVRLLDEIGTERAFSYLEKFSFSKLSPSDYTLSSALGGFTNGMTLLEMTNAYTTFASDGTFTKARGIKQVKDKEGNVLYEWDKEPIPVWSKTANEQLKTLLHRTVTRGTGKKAYVPGSYVGGKTGTTDDYKDIWFIGIYNDYTAGVWVGKDEPKSLKAIYNIAPQQLVWKEIMTALAQNSVVKEED